METESGEWIWSAGHAGQSARRRNFPAEMRERVKDKECELCHRKFGEHSLEEFTKCLNEIAEKQGVGWRSKKLPGTTRP